MPDVLNSWRATRLDSPDKRMRMEIAARDVGANLIVHSESKRFAIVPNCADTNAESVAAWAALALENIGNQPVLPPLEAKAEVENSARIRRGASPSYGEPTPKESEPTSSVDITKPTSSISVGTIQRR